MTSQTDQNEMTPNDTRSSVLITGASGGLASIVVDRLLGEYRLVGVDQRSVMEGRHFPGEFHEIDYRQRRMAEVFRQNKFHTLIHLGRVPPTAEKSQTARYNMNVLGTRSLLEFAVKYGVKNVIVFSTYHVYGAHQHNHLHITEDDPLRATQIFRELSDAVELDNISTAFVLKHPEIRTVVLRPVNVIGPRVRNQITRLLRSDPCPVLMGYDPMMQFVHENDIARALLMCMHSKKSGVYNIAGEGVIPYTRAVKTAGATPLPIPLLIAYPFFAAISHLGRKFPKHLMDYYRYPTIVSDAAFRREFGWAPEITTVDALKSVR